MTTTYLYDTDKPCHACAGQGGTRQPTSNDYGSGTTWHPCQQCGGTGLRAVMVQPKETE